MIDTNDRLQDVSKLLVYLVDRGVGIEHELNTELLLITVAILDLIYHVDFPNSHSTGLLFLIHDVKS